MSLPFAAPGHPEGLLRVSLRLGAIVLSAVCVFSLGAWFGVRVAASVPAAAPLQAVASVPAPAAEPPAPAFPAPSVPAFPAEQLTFYDRLSGAAPAPARVPEGQPPGQAPAAQESAAPPSERPAPPPAAIKPATAKALAPPARQVAAKPASKSGPARTPAADPSERIHQLTGAGSFAVQVAAISDRAAAAEAAARLKRQGLEVDTVMASVKGKTVYRVRVRSFPTREAADKAARIFRSELRLEAIPVRD